MDSQNKTTTNQIIEKEDKIDKLISSVFKDKSKQHEIIEKLRPFFSLKVIPQREIDRVYSAVEKIDPEKIGLIEEYKYEEEKYDSKNVFTAKSKSVGLSDFDLDLSVSILGHKQSLKYDENNEKSNFNMENNSKIHCIHSIVIKLFRIIIDFKEIKLAKQVMEELEEVHNSNVTEKKILLEKLVDKFGLYVPLELVIGGRINYSFDANNNDEIKEIHSLLQREIKAKFGGGFKFVTGSLEGNFNNNNKSNDSSKSLDKVENLSIKIEGGDYTYKEDFKKWIQSFNMENLQIIEYKTLTPIYSFIPGLESKLSICLEKYEDIVLKEIYSLIEKDFAIKEKEIFQGSSESMNKWKVGITQEKYKSFIIYKKKIFQKLKIQKQMNQTNNMNNMNKNEKTEENKNNKVKDVICGEIPDGFIICGWILKTNSNSKPYDVVANWERKKELQIIGNECFKFKIDLNAENTVDEGVEIDWILDIFCIHTDFLVKYDKIKNKNNSNTNNVKHYFINCDCNSNNNEDCYYNDFYKNNNFKKMDEEELKKRENSNSNLFPKPQPKKPYGNLFGNSSQQQQNTNKNLFGH